LRVATAREAATMICPVSTQDCGSSPRSAQPPHQAVRPGNPSASNRTGNRSPLAARSLAQQSGKARFGCSPTSQHVAVAARPVCHALLALHWRGPKKEKRSAAWHSMATQPPSPFLARSTTGGTDRPRQNGLAFSFFAREGRRERAGRHVIVQAPRPSAPAARVRDHLRHPDPRSPWA
jgi:hypothetical protein